MWSTLADELLIRVFQHLDWQALIYCGNTCSSWRTVACDESLWYDLLRQHPIYLTPSELKDTRLYRREFARRAMGLVQNHSHIPDSSHLAEFIEWLADPFPPINQFVSHEDLYLLSYRFEDIKCRFMVLSYYDNYIKEISKVALFTADHQFFASISFIGHKMSDFPGPTFGQRQGSTHREGWRPKGKTWKMFIHFANRDEVCALQFSISNNREVIGQTIMLEAMRDYLFPDLSFDMFLLILLHSLTHDSVSINDIINFAHFSAAKPISAQNCYSSFKEVPVRTFEEAIGKCGGDFVAITNLLPQYSWESLKALVKGYNSDLIVTRSQICKYWTNEQILVFQTLMENSDLSQIYENPLFDKRSLKIMWDAVEFYHYGGPFIEQETTEEGTYLGQKRKYRDMVEYQT
ncbi:hypothetical protein PROFUN_14066 [Planoprotostelium fungivorum]|uniref:F-box domain-containing protein n=1 Tax=Planoprotostelium fungivorum TaxID=1890364 RepID=A0A2P6N1X7_9EUKA|nr:hypothetical protein PROFUN_14066 [Planoprotostelium fungivorum]